MSSPDSIDELRRRQVRLVLQAAVFVVIGVVLGWAFSGLNSVAIFVVNCGFAAYCFGRALRIRTQMHVLSTDRRVTTSDRIMAGAVALSLLLSSVFVVSLVQRETKQHRIDEVGHCWATDATHSYAVDCDNPAARFRSTDVVSDKSECLVQFLERDNGEFICIEPLT